MKDAIATLALMVLCMTGIQCRTVLEVANTKDLHIEVTRNDDHTRIEISGLALHSALAAEGIRTRIEKSDLILKITLVPAHRGLSGSFHYSVQVPARIERVLFGDERQEIWPQRPPASSEPKP